MSLVRSVPRLSIQAMRRELHNSASLRVVQAFTMPAMSPTMTEGGIATWKVKPGQTFSAGDVLLEIETDKATMDVEAPEDGVMAKIVVEDGAKAVQVGSVIAMLAEEGDDISNVQVPSSSSSSEAKSSSKPTAAPSKPPTSQLNQADASRATSAPSDSFAHAAAHSGDARLFPSVVRLLQEHKVDSSSVKGTGVRGMLTKGDVLAHLGLAKSPSGTATKSVHGVAELGGQPSPGGAKAGKSARAPKAQAPLTPSALRSLILGGLADSSSSYRGRTAQPTTVAAAAATLPLKQKRDVLDELLADYQFGAKTRSHAKGSAKHALPGLL